jgi:hypothetical protein
MTQLELACGIFIGRVRQPVVFLALLIFIAFFFHLFCSIAFCRFPLPFPASIGHFFPEFEVHIAAHRGDQERQPFLPVPA